MKIFKIIIVIIFFWLPQTIFCQDESFNNFNNTIGLKLSNISGYGLYYNRKISEDFKLQLMGAVFYWDYSDTGVKHNNFNYSFGLEIQRNITKSENVRVYILAGAFYYMDDDKGEGTGYYNKTINHSFNVGVGLAGEYYYKRFILSFELGYKYYEDKLEITEDNNLPYPVIKRVTKIGTGVGVGFMF